MWRICDLTTIVNLTKMFEDWLNSDLQMDLLTTAVVLAVILAIYLIVRRVGSRLLRKMLGRAQDGYRRAETLELVGARVLQVVFLLLALAVILVNVWDVDLGAFLAFGAVFGAAIGFGAQHLVKDLIAGVFILVEDQFHIGDVVRIAETEGTVEDIQFRVTVLRDHEGNKHFVPNGQITVASNFTSIYALPVLDVGIAYKEDIDRAMAIMLDELTEMSQDDHWGPLMEKAPEVLGVQDLGDSAVVIRARMTVMADNRWASLREARRRVKNRFDAEGIEIPFPHMTLYQADS